MCRSSLLQIKPELEETHPIKLTTLDFQVFSRYLATLKKPSTRRSVVKMVLKMITLSMSSTFFSARLHLIRYARHLPIFITTVTLIVLKASAKIFGPNWASTKRGLVEKLHAKERSLIYLRQKGRNTCRLRLIDI